MDNQYNYYEQDYSNTDGSYQQVPEPKKKKKMPKLLAVIASAILFGLVASATFLGANLLGSQLLGLDLKGVSDGHNEDSKGNITTLTTSSGTVTSDVSAIVENAMPSVVSITNLSIQQVQSWFGPIGTQEATSSGSGIIIAENDTELLIVTNNHVVEGYQTLTVTFHDETSVEANVKGTDAVNDLAVIAVLKSEISDKTMEAIAIATMGDSTALKVGEPAIAIGNALGYGQSVTTGIISAVNRQISDNEDSVKMIQTDAAINPGNSGGALLNANGQVIGINSAKLADEDIEGMGYAIPISEVSDIITRLMNQKTKAKVAEEDRGYLGIQGYDIPDGVYVVEAIKGGGAIEAGIQKGDIIISLEGAVITNMDSLKKELQYYAAGEEVEITILTPFIGGEYQEQTVRVVLGEYPQD